MTERTKNKETTTLVSLISIIQKSRSSVSEGVEIYLAYSEHYHNLRTQFEAEDDQTELDSLTERERINDNLLLGCVALGDLIDILKGNPLPAKRARFFAVAVHLMPEVRLSYVGRGRKAWAWIFAEFELPRDFLIVFPVGEDVVDIESVERELLQLLNGRCSVSVKETENVLHWAPNSKTYRTVKGALESRGWKWKSVKVKGAVVKHLFAPVG